MKKVNMVFFKQFVVNFKSDEKPICIISKAPDNNICFFISLLNNGQLTKECIGHLGICNSLNTENNMSILEFMEIVKYLSEANIETVFKFDWFPSHTY